MPECVAVFVGWYRDEHGDIFVRGEGYGDDGDDNPANSLRFLRSREWEALHPEARATWLHQAVWGCILDSAMWFEVGELFDWLDAL